MRCSNADHVLDRIEEWWPDRCLDLASIDVQGVTDDEYPYQCSTCGRAGGNSGNRRYTMSDIGQALPAQAAYKQ
jgi:hypothetical protein